MAFNKCNRDIYLNINLQSAERGVALYMHVFEVYIFMEERIISLYFRYTSACKHLIKVFIPELARVTNSARLLTPGETKALAESKVHQI